MSISGIVSLDLHGKNTYQAKIMIDSALKKANQSVYRIRLIHGYHSGTAIRDMIRSEYQNAYKVKKIVSVSDAATDLVLREL